MSMSKPRHPSRTQRPSNLSSGLIQAVLAWGRHIGSTILLAGIADIREPMWFTSVQYRHALIVIATPELSAIGK